MGSGTQPLAGTLRPLGKNKNQKPKAASLAKYELFVTQFTMCAKLREHVFKASKSSQR